MTRRVAALVLAAVAGCSSHSAAPAALPTVTGATVTKVEAARTLCSGQPPTMTAPTARHTVLTPAVVAGLHRARPDGAAEQEYADGLVGSGQSLKLLGEYDDSAARVKAVVLSTVPGAYGTDRLAFLCRSATGYVTSDVTTLQQPGFTDDLTCFEIPKSSKPVLCSWYDDTAGTLTLTGVHATAALSLAVAFRAALEKPVS